MPPATVDAARASFLRAGPPFSSPVGERALVRLVPMIGPSIPGRVGATARRNSSIRLDASAFESVSSKFFACFQAQCLQVGSLRVRHRLVAGLPLVVIYIAASLVWLLAGRGTSPTRTDLIGAARPSQER